MLCAHVACACARVMCHGRENVPGSGVSIDTVVRGRNDDGQSSKDVQGYLHTRDIKHGACVTRPKPPNGPCVWGRGQNKMLH